MRKEIDVDRMISNVQYFCERNEICVADLSRISGVSDQTLYNLVNMKHIPAVTTLVKVADALDIGVDDLLFTDYRQLEKDIAETEKRLAEMKQKLGRKI